MHGTQTLHLHGLRAFLISLLLLAFLVVRLDGAVIAQPAQGGVKGYAYGINNQQLLDSTNQARHETGHQPLSLDQKLQSSAQAKADDMIEQDYWDHVAPDGSQPWKFFDQAGYQYLSAGENLAYGFLDSDATIAAWLNSPSHRDNLLGDYRQVGFGVAHGADYQGGSYTVIVAHYGTPAQPAAAATEPSLSLGTAATISTGQQLIGGGASTASLIGLSICLGAGLMFVATHRRLMVHAAVSGERFALRHPLLDASVLVAVIGLILVSRGGAIS